MSQSLPIKYFILIKVLTVLRCVASSAISQLENDGEFEEVQRENILQLYNNSEIWELDDKSMSEESLSSILSQATSALVDFAEDKLSHLKNRTLAKAINSYIQNLTKHYNIPGQDAVKIVGNTLDTFHDVAFSSENTSFANGFSNIAREVQTTFEDLGGMDSVHRIASDLGEQAKAMVGWTTNDQSTHTPSPMVLELTPIRQEESPTASVWLILIGLVCAVTLCAISLFLFVIYPRNQNTTGTTQVHDELEYVAVAVEAAKGLQLDNSQLQPNNTNKECANI